VENKRVTKKQLRVEIAQNVIKSMDDKVLIPSCAYFYYSKNDGKCHVCALGACLAGLLTSRGEEFTEGNKQYDIRNELPKVFSKKQLMLIEIAYERFPELAGLFARPDTIPPTGKQISRAYAFGLRYTTEETRMRAIMENIIRNGGQFKP